MLYNQALFSETSSGKAPEKIADEIINQIE